MRFSPRALSFWGLAAIGICALSFWRFAAVGNCALSSWGLAGVGTCQPQFQGGENRETILTSPQLGPDSDGKYTIVSPSSSSFHASNSPKLELKFVPYGASISNFFISPSTSLRTRTDDQTGNQGVLDIVAGWDNASYYSLDKIHPHFGGVVGRYANRIRNSSFTLPGENGGVGREVKVLPNENPREGAKHGVDTLHGGPKGWDWRNWTVMEHTESSITFRLVDADGDQGFEGEVVSQVTYTVGNGWWDISMVGRATTKVTPIMLSSHTYWNLDGFSNPSTATALNHTLHLPYAGQRVGTDTILIPTGDILQNEEGGVNDFWSEPRQLGHSLGRSELKGNCGWGCIGYDTCYINSLRPPIPSSDHEVWLDNPVAQLSSSYSGISMKIFTDQDALQVYNCVGQDSTLPLKTTQGVEGKDRVIENTDAWYWKCRTGLMGSITLNGAGVGSRFLDQVLAFMS